MLGSKKQPPVIYHVEVDLGDQSEHLQHHITREALVFECMKFVLLNRQQVPSAFEEMQKNGQTIDSFEQQLDLESAQQPNRRRRRLPPAARRVAKLLASIKELAACAGQPEHAGIRQFALALGTTPSRCRELYKITFLPSEEQADSGLGAAEVAAGTELTAPSEKQQREMARKLLRKLLMSLACTPHFEATLAPTKMHLLAHGAPSTIIRPLNATDGTAMPASHAGVDAVAMGGLQVAPYVPSSCDAAASGQSGDVRGVHNGMATRSRSFLTPKPSLGIALQRSLLQVEIVIGDAAALSAHTSQGGVTSPFQQQQDRLGWEQQELWWQCSVHVKGMKPLGDDGQH